MRVTRRRRAWMILLLGSVAMTSLHVALLLAIELMPRLRDPLFGDKAAHLQRRLAETQGTQPFCVVMLGTSRTGYGFDAATMENQLRDQLGRPCIVFNFGVPGTGPLFHGLYWQRLRAMGIRPDLLLVEVLPVTVGCFAHGPFEQAFLQAERLHPDELGFFEHYGADVTLVKEDFRQLRLNPWHRLRFQLLSRTMRTWVPSHARTDWSRDTDRCGWNPTVFASITPALYERGLRQAEREYAPHLATFEPGGPALQALDDLIRSARGDGVPTALVWMPEGQDFRRMYRPGSIEQLNQRLEQLCATHGATFLQAQHWVPDEEFVDSHHLLRRGARRFTKRLGESWILPRAEEKTLRRVVVQRGQP